MGELARSFIYVRIVAANLSNGSAGVPPVKNGIPFKKRRSNAAAVVAAAVVVVVSPKQPPPVHPPVDVRTICYTIVHNEEKMEDAAVEIILAVLVLVIVMLEDNRS